jgi:hypothetical protein
MTVGAVTLIKFSVVYRYVGAVLATGGFIVWVPFMVLQYFSFFKAFPHGNIFVHCKFIVDTIGFKIVFCTCALGLKKIIIYVPYYVKKVNINQTFFADNIKL